MTQVFFYPKKKKDKEKEGKTQIAMKGDIYITTDLAPKKRKKKKFYTKFKVF